MFLYLYSDLPCIGAFTAPTLTDRDFHPVDKTYDIIGREERHLEPVHCPGCKTINAPCANYCSTCGQSFTDDGEGTREAMDKDVLENPEIVRKLLRELIEEKKRKGEL